MLYTLKIKSVPRPPREKARSKQVHNKIQPMGTELFSAKLTVPHSLISTSRTSQNRDLNFQMLSPEFNFIRLSVQWKFTLGTYTLCKPLISSWVLSVSVEKEDYFLLPRSIKVFWPPPIIASHSTQWTAVHRHYHHTSNYRHYFPRKHLKNLKIFFVSI